MYVGESYDTIVRACRWLETVGGLPLMARAIRWYADWLVGRHRPGDLIIVDQLAAELRDHLDKPLSTGEA
jgi:hypothetical protein